MPSEGIRPLASRDGEPVFAEAWQAQTLAMADCLIGAGLFSAGDWANALGTEIRRHEDSRDGYFAAALAALERLLDRNGVSSDLIRSRRDAWERAFMSTPHGEPVELENGK